ncbi:uncharacterized protein [Arachis hypogaea]|uniref:Uncharacterized protein n=1 Tax=Arachis hypogaea TaxID=3818 RepID=A0A444WVI9_ARAHY|nr:uncharacterized protein LOC112746840 [Arachis hypogaea]XP_025703291.1 uncharacterized protein LOC112804074 [Arachis hypogaea]QHO40137.1 uncharacterized protein DS421_5g135050 [Arachis hypogaea]RYQ81392.1 hypothetical protein Ahy_Scaffold1g107332 [Arachis hypogaea]
MKKGKKTKLRMADFLKTPSPVASPTNDSPKSAIFSRPTATTSKAAAKRAAVDLTGASPPLSHRPLSSIADLKAMASAGVDDLRRQSDRSHSEILKDLEASHSRLHKRLKMQTQACHQVMDEAEKEYKKLSERITESREAMKASYDEFMAEAQASASRACKTSITELSQSFEKAIDSLRNRYGISSN